MKYIRVVIDMTLEVPDDTEIITPEDEGDFHHVRVNGQDYTLLHDWLKRAGEKGWTSLDDGEHEELGEVTQIGTVNSTIQAISEEEFREATGE